MLLFALFCIFWYSRYNKKKKHESRKSPIPYYIYLYIQTCFVESNSIFAFWKLFVKFF